MVKQLLRKQKWYIALYSWVYHDNWWLGKYVEITGDRITLDGVTVFLDHPSVQTRFKSRFLLDQYEGAERMLIKQHLDPRLPVIELGGSIGVVSCVINKRLHDPQKHLVIEANPNLITAIDKNRQANQCAFQVQNLAYSPDQTEVSFSIGGYHAAGKISDGQMNSVTVTATTLAELVIESGFPDFTFVCDIEGAEYGLFEHELEVLTRHAALIIVELHGSQSRRDQQVRELEEHGFSLLAKQMTAYVFSNHALPHEGLK